MIGRGLSFYPMLALGCLLAGVAVGVLFAEGPHTAYPCAAFASDGRSAKAVVTATALQLEVLDPSGQSRQAALTYESTPSDCRIFFPTQGDYLVAAVRLHAGEKQSLRVGTLNTNSAKWLSNFSVEPHPDFDSPKLAGFLENTSTLVATGYARDPSTKRPAAIESMLISPQGNVLHPPGFARTELGDPDAAHNRLWIHGHPEPCPWRSVSMIGDLADGPAFDERAVGDDPDLRRLVCEPDTINFPDADTVVGTATDSREGNWVWRVDLRSKDGDRLKLPQGKKGMLTRWGGYDISRTVLSPDGQVLAVSRKLTSFDLLDRAEFGNAEIDIIQVKPLRLLGVVRPKRKRTPSP